MERQKVFKRRLYIGFTLAILLCAASGITSYLILQKQQQQRVWVRKARSIVDSTASVQSILIDMETGIRGFRVTNQKRYLEPYYTGQQRLEPTLSTLKNLLADDPEVGNVEALMEQHARDLLVFWSAVEKNADTLSKEAVNKSTDDEKRQMDEVRLLIKELQKDETKLLNSRREENDRLIHYITLSTSIESILSATIIIVLIFIILREFKSRLRTQEYLRRSVDELREKTKVLQQSETELKQTTDELGEINKQLEQFVYTVAHDIKSPLTGIIGALDIIRSDEHVVGNAKLARFANLSMESATHLSDRINFLLEYSRVTMISIRPELVNTAELLAQVSSLLFPPKNIRIYIAGEMPEFYTRKVKMMQVFQNLISNAIKYNDKEKGVIDIGYEEGPGGYYRFFVKDNGQGIAPEYKDKVFTLSRTTSNQSSQDSSTGFGLNIARLIVEEQGGKMWFDSVPGKETTFYFEWKK
jgi:two-component system, sensor histidine kinase and response regulator